MVERAPSFEIMQHLVQLLGTHAQEIVEQSAHLLGSGQKAEGLSVLYAYDASLGGVGIYQMQDKKLPGIYRAITYVWMPLQQDHPEEGARSMIHAACIYLEELLKKIARIWLWEDIKADSLPLGTLVQKAKKRLPEAIYTELTWLSAGVYNPAKHHYNLENDDEEEEDPVHFFSMADALAVYLIVRKLGLELEKMIPISNGSLDK